MDKHKAFLLTSRLRKDILKQLNEELTDVGDSFSINLFEQTKDKEMTLVIAIKFED